MLSVLKSPRGLVVLVLVSVVVVVFILLGNWQLDRHAELSLDNQVRSARAAAAPEELSVLLSAVGDSVESLESRRAVVSGGFVPEGELLIRSQVNNGAAGFHVVTPFEFDGGTLLVNRGWVPLVMDTPPLTDAPPPSGDLKIEVDLIASQQRPRFGQVAPSGTLTVVNRIDLDRLSDQFPQLAPVWAQLISPTARDIPKALPAAVFDDSGPHLAYAFQWYVFALITVVGSVALMRSTTRRRSP